MKKLVSLLLFFSYFSYAGTTKIIAFGDTPYIFPGGELMFDELIDQTHRLAPDFAIHVGDIKSGTKPCTNKYLNCNCSPLII